MTRLRLPHLVYTSVPAARSPRDRAGYQTIARTPEAIPDLVVQWLEARFLYPADVAHKQRKLGFAVMDDNWSAVWQIVERPEPDDFGRREVLLAHAIVLDTVALAAIASNPFQIFDQTTFLDRLGAVPAVGGSPASELGLVEVTPVAESLASTPDAAGIDALSRRLAGLAVSASTASSRDTLVAFAGDAEAIEARLRRVFEFLPERLRRRCSFDTLTTERAAAKHGFWAVGIAGEGPRGDWAAVVDATTGTIRQKVSARPVGLFEQWIDLSLDESVDAAECRRQIDQAARVAWSFEGGASLETLSEESDLDEAVCETFRRLTLARIEDSLGLRLRHRLGERLTKRTLPLLLDASKTRPGGAVSWIVHGVPLDTAAKAVVRVLYGSAKEPPPGELTELVALIQHVPGNPALSLFLARWQGRWDDFINEATQLLPTDRAVVVEWCMSTLGSMPNCRVRETKTGVSLEVTLETPFARVCVFLLNEVLGKGEVRQTQATPAPERPRRGVERFLGNRPDPAPSIAAETRVWSASHAEHERMQRIRQVAARLQPNPDPSRAPRP